MDQNLDNIFDEGANEVLKPQGALSYDNSRLLREVLEQEPQFQSMFLDGDKGDQQQALNNVQKLASEVNAFKQYRGNNAVLWSNQNKPGQPLNSSGYSIGLQDNEEDRNTLANHSGDRVMEFETNLDENNNPDGFNLGFKTPDGSLMTTKDATSLANKYTVDTNSANMITKLRDAAVKNARDGDHNTTLNVGQLRRAVGDVIKNGKQISLMYDPLVKETSFREDLITSGFLGNITYSSLGLDPQKLKRLDKDGDGRISSGDNISREDQMSILDRFIKDPNLSAQRNELLTDYFTQYIKDGFDEEHQVHVNKRRSMNRQAAPPIATQPQKRRIG